MKAKFKTAQLFIGFNKPFVYVDGEEVDIVDQEDHRLYGRRYKIAGRKEWFEANCFEYVKE